MYTLKGVSVYIRMHGLAYVCMYIAMYGTHQNIVYVHSIVLS